MSNSGAVGLYGKLPSHGDFIHRKLPSNFINAWDSWLQGYMNSIREQIGDHWLDLYLTSPIWRFVLSPGIIDDKLWAGIMLPSVDRVGRYFPFTVAKPVAEDCNPFEVIAQSSWFEALEKVSLLALTGRSGIDQLADEIEQPQLITSKRHLNVASAPAERAAIIELEEDAREVAASFPCLLNSIIRSNAPSYSLWATQGSEHVDPCMFYCANLPRLSGIVAMLDGEWEQWGWPQPHQMPRRPHEAEA